jgi:23S rRNA (uridine2552-2'-O)-methyltransferase
MYLAGVFALVILTIGGAFLALYFEGGETEHLLLWLKLAFETVKHFKPKSSRAGSSEIYIVAIGFKG